MSRPYTPEVLPSGDVQLLSEALKRELRRISIALETVLDLDRTRQIAKPQEGMLRWFNASVYDPGSGTGLYIYNELGVWEKLGGGTTSTSADIISDTPPPSPSQGQGWINSATWRRFVWYDDGTSQQWVQADPSGATS